MKKNRKTIRLKYYDYSQSGMYYVTICTHNRQNIFGEIINGEIVLNKFGELAKNEWERTSEIRHNVILDEFIIMPNHIHGIIIIKTGRDTVLRVPTTNFNYPNTTFEQFGKPTSNSIPTIIRSFKSTVTKQINETRKTPGLKIWQSRFYEHVIRTPNSLLKIRKYIKNNPINWKNNLEFSI